MKRRVIFPDPDIWTHKEHHMTDQPAPINRPLTDRERDLLNQLLIAKLQTGIEESSGVHVLAESVAGALDDLIAKVGLRREGDNTTVSVVTGTGHVLLTVTREFLAFHAQHDEQITEDQLSRAIDNGDVK